MGIGNTLGKFIKTLKVTKQSSNARPKPITPMNEESQEKLQNDNVQVYQEEKHLKIKVQRKVGRNPLFLYHNLPRIILSLKRQFR